MSPLDPKKLVTGFLLLATAVTSFSLMLSGTPEPKGGRAPGTPQTSAVAKNVFVESLRADSGATAEPSDATTPNTLTDQLAKLLAQEIIAANPEGPTTAQGIASIAAPRLANVLATLDENPGIVVDAVVDRIEKNRAPKKTRVLSTYTQEDLDRYVAAYRAATANGAFSTSTRTALEGGASSESLAALSLAFDQAANRLESVGVPAPLEKFHEAALKTIVYGGNSLRINIESHDPLAETLVAQIETRRLTNALQELDAERGRLENDFRKQSIVPAKKSASLFGGALSIPKANAQLFCPTVPCLVFDEKAAIELGILIGQKEKDFWQKLLEFAKKVGTEILKDQIIHRLVQQTIQWVQGGGKPQFITDWKGFLSKAANDAVGNALYRISPQLCQSFGPLVVVMSEPVAAAGDAPIACTLSGVVRNVQDFAESFTKGGWLAYGAALEPQNNYFGAYIEAKDLILRESAAAKRAARLEAKAGKSFTPTKFCVQEEEVTDPATGEKKTRCLKYDTTTPAGVLANTVNDALGAPIGRIVNAEDFAALTSAVINALITKLINLGNTGINMGLLGVVLPDLPPQGNSCSDKYLRQSACFSRHPDDGVQFGQICGGWSGCDPLDPNSGIAYLFFYGFYEMYKAPDGTKYLFSGNWRSGDPSVQDPTQWGWFLAPKNNQEWCADNFQPTPVPPPTTNLAEIFGQMSPTRYACPPGERAEFAPVDQWCVGAMAEYYSCMASGGGQSSSTDPGNLSCGMDFPQPQCNCANNAAGWPEGAPQDGDYRFYDTLRAAQGAVRDRARAGEVVGYNASSERVDNNERYLAAVIEEIVRLGEQATSVGEDIIGIRGASDPGHVEYFDVISTEQQAIYRRKVLCKPTGNPNWP